MAVFDTLFDIQLQLGTCVGVQLPALADLDQELVFSFLTKDEQQFAQNLKPIRRRTFVGGRIALRRAFKQALADTVSVLPDERGAPHLPAGLQGSISHKDSIAVALVSDDVKGFVGVDIETVGPSKQNIENMILRPEEIKDLGQLDSVSSEQEVLLRFSLKEAVYKSLDPYVGRYVGFKEVAVKPLSSGRAEIQYELAQGEGPFVTELFWRQQESFFLTTAKTFIVSS